MSVSKISFQIHDLLAYKQGVLVMGRCTDGILKVNDIFSFVATPHFEKLDGCIVFAGYTSSYSVKVSVVEIHCFRKLVTELPHGYSGGLYLTGNDTSVLKVGMTLLNIL